MDYKTYGSLERSLGEFVYFFNSRRLHQSLDCMTPDEVYAMGMFYVLEKDIKVA